VLNSNRSNGSGEEDLTRIGGVFVGLAQGNERVRIAAAAEAKQNGWLDGNEKSGKDEWWQCPCCSWKAEGEELECWSTPTSQGGTGAGRRVEELQTKRGIEVHGYYYFGSDGRSPDSASEFTTTMKDLSQHLANRDGQLEASPLTASSKKGFSIRIAPLGLAPGTVSCRFRVSCNPETRRPPIDQSGPRRIPRLNRMRFKVLRLWRPLEQMLFSLFIIRH
jgi:hypothetical protein